MGKPVYSDLKMPWWLVREGWPPKAPHQVQLVLSDLCSHDCDFCSYRWSARDGKPAYSSNEMFTEGAELSKYGTNNPKRQIPRERALAMLDEFKAAGVRAIQFTGGGEPLAHNHHVEVFRKTLDIGLKAGLVSNGYRMSRELLDVLPRFEWVRISVDAGSPVTYSSIRRIPIDSFDKCIANISALASEIKRTASGCVLGVGFVVTPGNWREVVEGTRVARDTGAAYIRLSAMFSPDEDEPFVGIYDEVRESVAEAKRRYEDEQFAVYDLFKARVQDLSDKHPEYVACPYMRENAYVGGDQNVYTCCILAYNKRGLIGSIKTRRFDELWESRERKDLMDKWDSRGCPRCMYNDKNRIMNYLLDDAPPHVEFT